MIRFMVHSLHVLGEGQATEVLETIRTDKSVAYNDAELIRSTLHRKVWVTEIGHDVSVPVRR